MDSRFDGLAFSPADLLLPQVADPTKWAVVACDQYTAQPDYWQRVTARVGDAPSALKLILPESQLSLPGVAEAIAGINQTMAQYVKDNCFTEIQNALIYVERQLDGGGIRRGLVGVIDLEEYDYHPGSSALIRATEGTVLERIPPRVAVREGAPVELPHVLLLTDDRDKTVIEPLCAQKGDMTLLYDFDLMERGGHISGWKLGDGQKQQVAAALRALADPTQFAQRYHAPGREPMLFAVGDGNHSLATAKACYEKQKVENPLARYALVELTNLHDSSLSFEPIHRVVFGTKPQQILAGLLAFYPDAHMGEGEGHALRFVSQEGEGVLTVPHPAAQLPVGTLQLFLDDFAHKNALTVDYIHGEDVTRELSAQPDTFGFLLPELEKESLFPTVIFDGVLPRKTFSMGEAHDKRFYFEARKIK